MRILSSNSRARVEIGRTYASQVRLAHAARAPVLSPDDFTIEIASNYVSPLPCGGTCSGRDVCRADLNLCQRPAEDCDPACETGECFENEDATFICSAVGEASERIIPLYEGTGHFIDAEVLSSGEIGVTWYNATTGNLEFANTNAGTFAETQAVILDGQIIDDESGELVDTGDVGWFPDLFVDGAGSTLIVFGDASLGDLRVIDLTAGTNDPVDDGFRCYDFDGEHCIAPLVSRVGYDAALAEQGGVFAVYQDAPFHEVIESPRTEFGWDLPGTVATGGAPYTGAYGFYNAHGVDATGRFVVSYRINSRAEPPTRDVVVLRR